MYLSIIIPTFNRSQKLADTLNSLKNQPFRDFELIIVNDGSTDNTLEQLNNIRPDFKSVKVITQENRGRAGARNAGARESSGNILLFYDDDLFISGNSLVRHMDFHRTYSNALCGGNEIENESVLKTDFGKFRYALTEKWTKKYMEGLNLLTSKNLFLSAANFSIPRDLFSDLGGFDENLSDSEDYELATRALKMGHRIFFDKLNIVYHNEQITCKSFILRARQYNESLKLLKKRESRAVESEFAREVPSVSGLKRSLFAVFSHKLLVHLIDRGMFKWIPLPLKYKFYDYVVTGLTLAYPERRI